MKFELFIKSLIRGKNCPECQSPLLAEDRVKKSLDELGNLTGEKDILKVPEGSAVCPRCGLKIEIKVSDKKVGKK